VRASDTSSATRSTVSLGMVSDSLPKFANITYAWSARRITLELACDVISEDWRALGSVRVRARAGKIPSIGIWTGSTITEGGGLPSL
jgi:hypothetical protein